MKLTPKKEQELLDRIVAIKDYEAQKKALEKNINGLKDEIKAFMDKKNVSELSVNIFTVRYTEVPTERFDSTAFRETHEALFEQYLKTSLSKRFTIT